MHKTIVINIGILMLLLNSGVSAQTQDVREISVTKGDTLWTISGKELSDPFLWPKVWKENPEIKNPDRIYPGQTIRIPLYLLRDTAAVEEQPPVAEAPVAAPEVAVESPVMKEVPPPVVAPEPMVNKNILISSGYISETVGRLGEISGSPSSRNMFGDNDIIYVKTAGEVKIGDRFYIVRQRELIEHPVTRKKMGYLIEIRGIAEIFQFEYGQTKARIIKAFGEILTGDILDTFFAMEPPVARGSYRKPDISGNVVAAKDMNYMNALLDVVYIDKGQQDGVEVGDMFKTVAVDKHLVNSGIIQVISVRDNTSVAIVRSGSLPISRGHLVLRLD